MKIPQPISGGLMLSYQCPAECRHCMYACSPQWAGDWITVEMLERYLPKLAEMIQPSPYGPQHMSLNHGLHFSGGEPFLNFKLVCRTLFAAGTIIMTITAISCPAIAAGFHWAAGLSWIGCWRKE